MVAAAAGAAEVRSPNSCRPSRSEEAKEGRAGAGAGSRPSRSAEAEGRAEGAAGAWSQGAVTGRRRLRRPSRSEEAKGSRAGAGSRPSRSAEAEGRAEGAVEGVVTGRGGGEVAEFPQAEQVRGGEWWKGGGGQ